jgi:methionyl-tRNA formyltransferase
MNLILSRIDRIVLLGGGKLIVSLVNWCKAESVPISVVTSPRHASEIVEGVQKLAEFLETNSVPYLATKDTSNKETKLFLGDLSSSFCLSLGAAWIFKEDTIKNIFNGKLFNLHGTRLPQNRGGGGFSWQIMMGNRLGFCQLHLIDDELDTGDLVKTKEFLYPPSCRIPEDYEKVFHKENLKFVIKFIEEILQQGIKIQTVRQQEYFSSYWPRLSTEKNAWIDWSDKIESLERFICAFDNPYEGSKTFLNGQKVFLKDVMSDFGDQQFHKYQSGIVYRKGPSWISVCANGGTLIVRSIVNEKGDNMLETIKTGDRFVTPSSHIDSRYERVVYTPSGIK